MLWISPVKFAHMNTNYYECSGLLIQSVRCCNPWRNLYQLSKFRCSLCWYLIVGTFSKGSPVVSVLVSGEFIVDSMHTLVVHAGCRAMLQHLVLLYVILLMWRINFTVQVQYKSILLTAVFLVAVAHVLLALQLISYLRTIFCRHRQVPAEVCLRQP